MYQFLLREPAISIRFDAPNGWGNVHAHMTMATAPYTDMNDLFVTSASALGIRHEPYFFDRLAGFEFFDFEEARDHAMISIASPMPDIIVEQMVQADKTYGGLK